MSTPPIVTTTVPTAAPVVTKPSTPISASSLAQQVNRAQGATTPIPAGLVSKNTKSITSPWLRALIYGETNARKTTTAALFDTPENVRIILNRGEDQLIPLRNLGYEYVHCDTMQKLKHAMMYPETLWPDWAKLPNRTLVIDDLSKSKEMMLDDHEFNERGTKNNNMIVHREAKADMAELMKSLFNKPMHIIAIAFAKIYENSLTHEENVAPDLPPGILQMVTADFSFCFYIQKSSWMFVTNDKRETYRDVDEKMVMQNFTRVIMAKNKIPKDQVGKGVINDLEKMDLADIWKRIQGSKGTK